MLTLVFHWQLLNSNGALEKVARAAAGNQLAQPQVIKRIAIRSKECLHSHQVKRPFPEKSLDLMFSGLLT